MESIDKIFITWDRYGKMCEDIASKIKDRVDFSYPQNKIYLYGIPRGGTIVANILSYLLDIPVLSELDDYKKYNVDTIILVDDIMDSGKTIKNYWDKLSKTNCIFMTVTLILNNSSECKPDIYSFYNEKNQWISFPYDVEEDTISLVKKR